MNNAGSTKKYTPSWQVSNHEARLWRVKDAARNEVVCNLSPRNCKLRPGQYGFCGVRQNIDGKLVTLNYGRASRITQESIETEAIFHYQPGSPILSLGNIGCMMNCDYCQNWTTSQARLASASHVHHYTPEEIVKTALDQKIPIISWTYNDPVVWHEFVLDTSRLARAHGIKVLYKSAFFITPEAIEELLPVVDIFSLSLKSLDPVYYRKLTKGWIEPVLEGIKIVHKSGRHLELSCLMVTDASDSPEDARKLSQWVVNELGERIPLHLVRFHPDYKYTHVGRTPVERLIVARQIAREAGIRHCYLGNVSGVEGANTMCWSCDALLIERYGLNARVVHLDARGHCTQCGADCDVTFIDGLAPADAAEVSVDVAAAFNGDSQRRRFEWRGDVCSLHVEVSNPTSDLREAGYVQRIDELAAPVKSGRKSIAAEGSFRFIVSKSNPEEKFVDVYCDAACEVTLYEVFDRAHFPTVAFEGTAASTRHVPLPLYSGRGHDGCAE